MCGIAGIIGKQDIGPMLQVQHHRGPDDTGTYQDSHIQLGMNRLSIIDLVSDGLCPYQEDEYVLAYNGEIYNYIELRKELQRAGWDFRTTSDTEVLMKAWRHWGTTMFDRLNGMFAIALYDKRKKQLLLARDIAGEKPLYYYQGRGSFAFASEAKALVQVFTPPTRRDEFYEAFQHAHITTPWAGLMELPAAHYMLVDVATKKTRIKEYWTLPERTIRVKTAQEELEELLKDAVRIRTRSDVPYGLYYSKGIDSSLIRALFKFKKQFYFDDTQDWKKDFFATLPKVAWHLDVPVGSLSSYPLWKLAQRASKSVKVVLSGEGADEIFGGYMRYMPVAREFELRRRHPAYKYLLDKHMTDPLDAYARITVRNDNVELVRETLRPFFEKFEDPIHAMGFADFKLIMPSLLQMGDRMAASASIENRCPFLDRRIIEFGFNLPSELKIFGLDQKVILRNILAGRGIHTPLRSEKKGLTVRFNQWLGKKDWDRSDYFSLLNAHWRKAYGVPLKGAKAVLVSTK